MRHYLVSEKMAVELKKLGFNSPCTFVYSKKEETIISLEVDTTNYELKEVKDKFTVPTYFQVVEFLGEKGVSVDFGSSFDERFNTVYYTGSIKNYKTGEFVKNVRSYSLPSLMNTLMGISFVSLAANGSKEGKPFQKVITEEGVKIYEVIKNPEDERILFFEHDSNMNKVGEVENFEKSEA